MIKVLSLSKNAKYGLISQLWVNSATFKLKYIFRKGLHRASNHVIRIRLGLLNETQLSLPFLLTL
jgi:hypothetical protein